MKKSVDSLETPYLDYWFLRAIGWEGRDLYFEKGVLLFYLNDDANPPGMYVWARNKTDSDEYFREVIKRKFGEEVEGTPHQLKLI